MRLFMIFLILMLTMVAFAGQQFETGSAIPTTELLQDLETLYNTKIKDQSVIKITVEGHTDSRGSEAYNLDLSERRAKAVGDVLAKLGTNPSKIITLGRGESKLLTTDNSLLAHASNRRVVVTVETSSGLDVTVISEANVKKCEPKTIEKVVIQKEPQKKNIILVGARKDFVGLETTSSLNQATVRAKKDIILDLSLTRRNIQNSNIDLGAGLDTTGIIRVFGGVEF